MSVQAEGGSDGAVLDLTEGVWQVQALAPGYWSQGAEVVVSRQAPANLRLAFWPAASLHGEVAPAGEETVPDVLEVRLSATPSSVGEISHLQTPVLQVDPSPSHAELHCRIEAGAWSCLGPVGLFDVRLEAPGYAPRYEWAVRLKGSHSADFGRTELRRTASIFGRAIRNDGSNPSGPCAASLLADMERRGPTDPEDQPESGPDANTNLSAALSQRGYFQIVGVPPGRYALSVECPAASGFEELRVRADTETRIDPPLSLEELTLDISLTPKVDPASHPWKLAVYETAPHFRLIADGATTSGDGRWIKHGLMAGNYHVIVRGSDGTAWLERYFDLGRGTRTLSFRLGFVRVAGSVKLSSRPVRARLVFSNNAGGGAVTLTSGNNGRFQGLLPVADGVQESNWTVEAHVARPPVTQRLLNVSVQLAGGAASAWLDLDLPAVAVHGSVVLPDGKPQRDAQVTFENSRGARTATGTDDEGRFEMADLPPGKYIAVADSRDGVSDRKRFDVTEGSGSELRLVLNPFKRVSFDVVSSQGPVADAAVQVWITPGVPRAFVRTDQEGRFEVTLPPGTTEVGLTIGAPGYALKLTRVPVPNETDESSDAHTITLDASGATLVLNFQPSGSPLDNSAMLYLVHNRAIQDALTTVGWGAQPAGADGNGPAIVEVIEPGTYALCSVADPAQLAALWSGPPPSDRCRAGSVEEGRTLTLSPP